MSQITIPLIGAYTHRSQSSPTTTTDARFVGCYVTQASDSVTGTRQFWAEKRCGLNVLTTLSANGSPVGPLFYSPSLNQIINAIATELFVNASSVGLTSGNINHITETIINSVTFILAASADQTGWFYASNMLTTFTGNRTSGSPIVSGIASTTGLYPGQKATGTGFVAGTRILTVDSSTQVTLTNNASSGAPTSTVFVTEQLAKIIDTDFPTNITGGFAEMGGWVFIMTTTGRVYNSDLNSVTSWNSSNYFPCNQVTDIGVGVVRFKENILGCGKSSIEILINIGGASNSPLANKSTINIGVGPTSAYRAMITEGYGYVFFADTAGSLYKMGEDGIKKVSYSELPQSSGGSELSIFKYFDLLIVHYQRGTPANWYIVDNDIWTDPGFEPTVGGAIVSIGGGALGASYSVSAVAADGTGKLYSLSSNTSYQDNGAAFSMILQTEPKVLNKGRGFIINSVELLADNQSSGSSTLEVSRDDYASWETIGTYDLTQTRKIAEPGGYCDSSCAFRITDAGNNAWRGQAIIVDYDACV